MELTNRDDLEDEMYLALMLLWTAQRKRFDEEGGSAEFWEKKEQEDREWLVYWLSRLFMASAVQHGLPAEQALPFARNWSLGHSVNVLSGFRRHTLKLLGGPAPATTVFGEGRARRFVTTEFTEAQSAGGEAAKIQLGELSDADLWVALNPEEKRCPYCGRLHMKPRSDWRRIYYQDILTSNPEMAIYGEPDRPPKHPHCNCIILYRGESLEEND